MTTTTTAPDFAAIKQRQQAAWSTGNYAVVGTTLQIVGELIAEEMNLQPGWRVLDVAAGNGNATLAAARRWCDVTSTDYVGALLANGRARAEAEGLKVAFQEADAEALPFEDASFDAAVSTFGVMFTPNQEQGASEMLRVTRSGGRIGLANWTPDSFIGQLFKIIGAHVPPPAGVRSPALWGTEGRIKELFAGHQVAVTKRYFNFRYKSPNHWLEIFRTYYGPTNRAFAALEGGREDALEADILTLLTTMNTSGNETLLIPSEYLSVVLTKR
ncbi:MAG: class I SAM-dependent methyltransferase [Acidimicrobiia bacterium]